MQAGAATHLGADRAPPGALRILARRGDSQILILHGEERAIGNDERLAWVEWFASPAIAEEISRFCSHRLRTGHFPPDAQGWHLFPVEHLKTLIGNAKTHLNIGLRQKVEAPRERQAWTGERNALLGTLASQGWTAKKIAAHPLIRTSEGNVYRQAHRVNVALPGASQSRIVIRRLPVAAKARLERIAEREGLTPEAVATKLLVAALENEDGTAAAT